MSGLEIFGAITAAGGALTNIKICYNTVKQLKRAPQDLAFLLGELNFVEVALRHAQKHLQSLKPDGAQNTASPVETKEWVAAVADIIHRANETVEEIDQLVARFSHTKNNKTYIKRTRWLIEADTVKAARLSLSSIRQELNFALGIARNEHHLETRDELSRLASLTERIFRHSSQQARIMSAQEDSIKALTQAFEDSVRLQGEAGMSRRRSDSVSQSIQERRDSDSQLGSILELVSSSDSDWSLSSVTQELTALRPSRYRTSSDDSIDIPAVQRHYRLRNTHTPGCLCSCHKSTLHTIPKFMSMLVGDGSITLSGWSAFKTACDRPDTCMRESTSCTTRLTYVFPTWFAAKAISMYSRSGPLVQPELQLRTRRVALTEAYRMAQTGDIQALDKLYNSGKASVHDVHPQEGQSALLVAVWCGQANVVRYLLSRNAQKEEQTFGGLETNDAVIRHVYGKVSPSSTTALLAHLFHLEDTVDEQRWSIIHKIVLGMASSRDLDTECHDHPELINERDLRGRTPLWWAALRHDFEACEILLRHFAKPDTSDYQGETAIQNAAASVQSQILELLLDYGAKIEPDGHVGETPLHYACRSNSRVANVRLLLERGGSPNASNVNGFTPFHECIEVDAIDVASLLCGAGMDLTLRDTSGETFVHMAIRCQAARILALLIREGCSLTPLGVSQQNTLHYAAQFSDLRIVELLSNAGIDGMDGEAKDAMGIRPSEYLDRRIELTRYAGDRFDTELERSLRSLFSSGSEQPEVEI